MKRWVPLLAVLLVGAVVYLFVLDDSSDRRGRSRDALDGSNGRRLVEVGG